MAWCYGSAWATHRGYAWNNTNNEPSWKTVAYAEDIPTVWTGTLAQYNAISPKNASTIYLISD